MSHRIHDLADDLPEYAGSIRKLKARDAHFARRLEAYDAVNAEVQRIESGLSASDWLRENALRRERMALKAELCAMLREGGRRH